MQSQRLSSEFQDKTNYQDHVTGFLIEEKKEASSDEKNHPVEDVSVEPWLGSTSLAMSQSIYNKLGIFGIDTGHNENANEFITPNSIKLGPMLFSYGHREHILYNIGRGENYFSQADRLIKKLQSVADQWNPTLQPLVKDEEKNINIIYAYAKPSPIIFSPLFLSEGIPDNASAENFSLRLYPFIQKGADTYHSTRFKLFTIEFFMFGASLIGKTNKGNHISILTEAIELSIGEKICQVLPCSISFIEEVQFEALKLITLMMLRLGDVDFKVVCHLHFVENVLRLFLLYYLEKIELSAFDAALNALVMRRKAITSRLKFFFAEHKIGLLFSSSLDGIFGDMDIPNGAILYDYFSTRLKLSSKLPDPLEEHQEELVDACLLRMSDNPSYSNYLSLWVDFLDIVNENKIPIKSLESFFDLAAAISIRHAAVGMSSHEVCSLQFASRMHIQQMLNFCSFVADKKNEPTRTYVQKTDERFPQRSAVNYSKRLMEVSRIPQRNPAIFNIGIFDPVIAENFREQPSKDTRVGVTYFFKDTKDHKGLSMLYGTFFKQAAQNAAHNSSSSVHVPLHKMRGFSNAV